MRRLETVETAAAAALAGLVRGLMAGAATQGGEHGAAEVDHRRGQDAPVVEGTGHGGGGHSSPRNPLEVGALTKQCEALQARWWSQKGRRRAKKASRSLFPGAISCRRAVAPWRPRPLGKTKSPIIGPSAAERSAECERSGVRSVGGRWLASASASSSGHSARTGHRPQQPSSSRCLVRSSSSSSRPWPSCLRPSSDAKSEVSEGSDSGPGVPILEQVLVLALDEADSRKEKPSLEVPPKLKQPLPHN